MAFYIEAIKLYGILDRILSDVYSAWRGRSRQDQARSSTKSLGGLDIVLEIERQLTLFESNLPSFLKWSSAMHSDTGLDQAIAQQRNVLHARYVPDLPLLRNHSPNIYRYVHLHLLLHRPIFTQLYSERVRERETAGHSNVQDDLAQNLATRRTLYSSMATKSATACVMAAIDLTHLVHETYHTSATDSWWYNGFCRRPARLPFILHINSSLDVSTAAIVLLMSFSAPSMLRPSAMDKAREAWREATSVLESMATVSLSASNTLRFLRAAYRQAVPGYSDQQTGADNSNSNSNSNSAAFHLHMPDMAHSQDPFDHPDHDLLQVPFFNWEEYAANMGQGEGHLDDLGFLTRLDFPDTLA